MTTLSNMNYCLTFPNEEELFSISAFTDNLDFKVLFPDFQRVPMYALHKPMQMHYNK